MFTLKIENSSGEIFELSHNLKNYAIVGIEGLTPPKTVVNTSTGGGLDGTFYNSSRVEQRNIVIDTILNGDIEANRQRLYRIFPRKLPCTIYFENKYRHVKILGYVEVLEGNLFEQREQMQISIICPRPFFEDMETIYTELSRVVSMFEFPFSISVPIPFSEIQQYPLCTIKNTGDAECGCTITVAISGNCKDLTIYNVTTQTYLGIKYEFVDGDEITICTVSGKMGVTLNRKGQTRNLLNYITAGSTWFRLALGDNDFTFKQTGDSDAVKIMFATAILYGGV